MVKTGEGTMYNVRAVTRDMCADLILNVHYAHRWPSITYAYGLFLEDCMVGCVTYGTPPSAPLRRGIAGDVFVRDVLELNRLCLYHNKKNEASRLIARSLRLLPHRKIIISFADISVGHVGVVYQATNFTYHGLSAKRTDWKVRGKEHLHGQTVADEFRGCADRRSLMVEKYGDAFYLAPRARKHRYIYITGDARDRAAIYPHIRYKRKDYPR